MRVLLLVSMAAAACGSVTNNTGGDGGVAGDDGGASGGDDGGGGDGGGMGSTTATLVAVGRAHSCAVTAAGGVRCWGFADHGQLGNGVIDDSSAGLFATPVAVQGLAVRVTAISSFEDTVCVVAGGAVKCWGANGDGQLGDNTTATSAIPVDVLGLSSGYVAVAVGGAHACALGADGGVKCWGKNDAGQLGDGSTVASSPVAVQVKGLASGVRAIASGLSHTCAAMNGTGVKCWGSNLFGEQGNGTAGTGVHVPGDVATLTTNATTVGAGNGTSCAILAGALRCWGRNADGEIGNGQSGTGVEQHTPAAVTGIASGATLVGPGFGSMCALVAGGARCWGSNLNFTLGNGADASFTSTSPVAVTGLNVGVTHLSGSSTDHACAVVAGAVKCWGSAGAHLGTGDPTTNAPSPVSVVGFP